jgi:hypothetical protein
MENLAVEVETLIGVMRTIQQQNERAPNTSGPGKLHLQPFEESNETFTNYLLRLKSYLELKGLVGDEEDVDKIRVNTLIIFLGPEAFQLLSSLNAPDSPTSKTFEVLPNC